MNEAENGTRNITMCSYKQERSSLGLQKKTTLPLLSEWRTFSLCVLSLQVEEAVKVNRLKRSILASDKQMRKKSSPIAAILASCSIVVVRIVHKLLGKNKVNKGRN